MNFGSLTKKELIEQLTKFEAERSKSDKNKSTQIQSRKSQEQYRALLDNLPQKIFIKDSNCVYQVVNDNYARDMKVSADEMVGKTDFDFYPEAFAKKYREDDKKIIKSKKPKEVIEKYAKDGKEFWVQTIKTPILSPQGKVNGILGMFWDITDRKLAEDKQRSQWGNFLAIIDNFPEVLYVVDPQTYEVLFANKVFEKLLGKKTAGKKCYKEFQGLDQPCSFCTNDIILKERKPYTWEHHNKLIDKHFYITDQIIKWSDGRDVRFEIAVDITKRKKLELELQKSKENLEQLVHERTAELEKTNRNLEKEIEESNRKAETIDMQTQEIISLSTPIMQIWDGVLVAPLIGNLDSQRTQHFMDTILDRIADTNAKVAIIDITGVPIIDTQTGQYLIETMTAIKLLGAKVILTGVRAGIAQTLVHLGVDLSTVETRSSLHAGLKVAMQMPGVSSNDNHSNGKRRA